MIRILWERAPTCFWHDDCEKMVSPPMKIVSTEADYEVLECCACGKRGHYPVGGSALMCCDEPDECHADKSSDRSDG